MQSGALFVVEIVRAVTGIPERHEFDDLAFGQIGGLVEDDPRGTLWSWPNQNPIRYSEPPRG